MRSNKPLIIMLVVIAVLMVSLAGFYLYLTGGQGGDEQQASGGDTGIVHIRSIYTYGDGSTIRRPVGVSADDDGGFFVTLRDDATVIEFTSDGDYVRSWGDRGARPGQMMSPLGVTIDRLAGHVYVLDRARLRLIAYDTEGAFLWEVPLLSPLGAALTPEGDLIVATFGPLVRLSPEGELIHQVGSRGATEGQFDFPRNVVVGEDGDIFVADTNNTRIQRVELSGELTATVEWAVGEPPRFQDDPQTRFVVPSGIALDRDGRVVVLDGFRHTIEIFDDETGEEIHVFGERRGQQDGLFNLPTGLTHLGNNYFAVTDTFNDRVQIIRILTPEQNNVLSRNPWLWWLLPLLLLPLLALLGRKKTFATRETLEKALEEESVRLVLAVHRKLYVLPEVAEEFNEVMEAGVRIAEYLVAIDPSDSQDDSATAGDEAVSAMLAGDEARLASAAALTRSEKLLLRRHRVICEDEEQCSRVAEHGATSIDYERLKEEYSLNE